MRRRSLRARLAVTSGVIAAVVLGVLAVVVTMQVGAAAASTAAALARSDLQPYVVDLRAQPEEGPDLPASGVLILVIDPSGRVRRDSMPAALAENAQDLRRAGTVSTGSGRFAVAARTVDAPGGTWRLWAARDLTSGDVIVRGIGWTVLIGVPIGALAIGLVAWFGATAALRPVERMRRSAERLRRVDAEGELPTAGDAELARLATTLNGMLSSLRASIAHERRLSADAAHELRTPLAVLTARVERAEQHLDPRSIRDVRDSVDRVNRVTDSLLALARADSTDSEPGAATVAELITEAMDEVDRARALAPAGVSVDLALDGTFSESATVRIDAVGFSRVLTNLVQNALAAGADSSVVLRLASEPGAVVVAVEDDGPGVPPDFLATAFDRFARPETSRARGATGAGLGLALVRRLAERAGGTADLQNRSGSGAIAIVRLPVEDHDADRRSETGAQPTPAPAEDTGAPSRTRSRPTPESAAAPIRLKADRSPRSGDEGNP
jgi:two-component system, OmpR family, sensor kinase